MGWTTGNAERTGQTTGNVGADDREVGAEQGGVRRRQMGEGRGWQRGHCNCERA